MWRRVRKLRRLLRIRLPHFQNYGNLRKYGPVETRPSSRLHCHPCPEDVTEFKYSLSRAACRSGLRMLGVAISCPVEGLPKSLQALRTAARMAPAIQHFVTRLWRLRFAGGAAGLRTSSLSP